MEEKLNKTTKIKIEFASWFGKATLEIDAETTKEAVEAAVKNGANLDGANLDGANLDGANHNDKKLWGLRPVLQLGCCGSVGRSTLVMFYADKSEPMIYCGCFSGTIEEFEAEIYNRQGGNRALAQFAYMSLRICRMRAFSQLKEGRYECTAEHGQSRIDGIEAWLNAPAESEVDNG